MYIYLYFIGNMLECRVYVQCRLVTHTQMMCTTGM